MNRLLSFIVLFLCLAHPGKAQLSVDFTVDHASGCSPLVTSFYPTINNSSASYQWDLGNGNSATTATPQAIYTTPGIYTVTLTVTIGGRTMSASRAVTVYANPSVTFSASSALVCSSPVSFTASGGAFTGYLWDFGDGSTQYGGSTVTHSFATQGMMTVSLTVSDDHGCTASVSQPNIVQVLPKLTAGFTSDKSVLCKVTDPVQFTNTSTGPGTLSYSWDFADGTTSTQPSPAHSYNQSGNYPVKLTVNSSVGCVSSAQQATPLNVANYHTDYTPAIASICANTPLTLTDISSPTANSSTWSVDGVPTYASGFHQLNYTFLNPGSHTITLANLYGACPQQITRTIQVNALPTVPPFDMTGQSPCGAPVTVNFADRSNPAGIANWHWYFQSQDGSPTVEYQSTTSGAASHTFTNNGQYNIILQVTNAAGCISGHTEYLAVTPPSVIIHEVAPASASGTCNQPITKTLAWNPPVAALQSWTWDFGDGTTSTDPSPTHTWTQPGQYAATLHWTDVNGCSGVSNAIPLLISPPMNLDFSTTPTTVCVGSQVNFSSPSLDAAKASSVIWNYGDGASGSQAYHIYSQAGLFTVTLNAANAGGCTATVTKNQYITVLPPPGHYDGYTTTCDGSRNLITFSYTQLGATSIYWDFGDGVTQTTPGNVGQVQHSYPRTGTYYINLDATNGVCDNLNSDVVMILMKQNPVLSASSATVCSNASLNVFLKVERNPREVNSGYYDDYIPAFYYGDGTPFGGTVNFTNPNNAYINGAFEWTLTGFQEGKSGLYVATRSFGFNCTDQSNMIPLTIQGSATSGLTVTGDNQCFKSPVQFTDASTVGANNTITSWTWDFGDGVIQTNSTGASVSHAYAQPGLYTARLTIKDQGGCQSSSAGSTANVQVNGPAPIFTYAPSRVLMGNTVYFYNSSNTIGSPNTSYSWDFGDGTSSTIGSPTHVYPNPGTYVVTMTAKGATGNTCTLSTSQTIVVNYFNPHFQIAPLYVSNGHCPPVMVQFTNTSTNYTNVTWDFGDGTTAGNLNYPSHVYTTPGAYQVTLSVYGTGGLIGKYTDSVFVRQPSASVTAKTPAVCVNQPEQLQAKAKGALSFVFDYGDGTISSGLDSGVTHVYAQSGDYTAQLVVTDTVGCSVAATAPVSVRVNPLPTISISPVDPHVCLGSGTQLKATGGRYYQWTPATALDDPGSASPVASPVVNTTYSVTATDDNGCQGQSSINVKVVFPEQLSVTPDSTGLCLGDTLRLQAKGTDVFEWIGDIDGLSSTTSANPLAQPVQTAHYRVVGSDAYACFSDTAAITLTVLPLPTVNGGGGVEVLDGTPVTLAATGSADIVRWEWTPADYLSCTDCAQPVCTPKKPELYQVLVTNDVGCHARDSVSVKLLCIEANVRIPEAFSPNGDGHNDRFNILGIGEVDHLVIYDRWGVKVFERDHYYTADWDAQWDGMFHGQPAPTGVYAYFVQMSCPSGGSFTRKGTVVLVR